MRTISSTLLAAAQSRQGVPVVTADLANRRLRWAGIVEDDSAQCWSDQVADGVLIHRVRVSGTMVHYARVTDPASPAQWTAWQVVASGAANGSDCAIARVGSGQLRLFYAVLSGGSTSLCVCTSADGGLTWSAPTTIVSGLTTSPTLAAAYRTLFYTTPSSVATIAADWGGAWVAGPTWSALPALTTPRGLGADYANDAYCVIAAADGYVWVGTLCGGAWSAPLQLAPGGNAPAPASAALRGPDILAAAGPTYLVTWVEDYTAAAATWLRVIVRTSPDLIHFGNEVSLAMSALDAASERRAALATVAPTRRVYAANEQCVYATTLYDAADAAQNLEALAVTAYRRETGEWGSRLVVEVLNTGSYDGLSAPIAPLTAVVVQRGYRTSAGAETVPLDPHYITEATVDSGYDSGHLVLRAVDGWGLLALWQPQEPLRWEGQTIAWLLAEIVGRVGLSVSAAAPAFATVVSVFTASPAQDGLSLVRQLLHLGGGVGYFDAAGTLQALNLYAWSPLARPHLGSQGETLHGRYGVMLREANAVRVFGNGVVTTSDNATQQMAEGLRRFGVVEDYRITTAAAATQVEQYHWARGRMGALTRRVTLPLRPELELHDLAYLHAPATILGGSSDLVHIVALGEEYDSSCGVYRSTVEMVDQ